MLHTSDPRFALELEVDKAVSDHIGKDVIRRLRLPNSWGGNHAQHGKFIAAAREFFQQSFAESAPKVEPRRFQS